MKVLVVCLLALAITVAAVDTETSSTRRILRNQRLFSTDPTPAARTVSPVIDCKPEIKAKTCCANEKATCCSACQNNTPTGPLVVSAKIVGEDCKPEIKAKTCCANEKATCCSACPAAKPDVNSLVLAPKINGEDECNAHRKATTCCAKATQTCCTNPCEIHHYVEVDLA